ncbi:MAG: hypothetical protein ACNA8G_07685 [Gammaproteobacteria bacterium]
MTSPADMAYNNRILNVLWYGSLGGPMVVATAFLAFELEIGVGWVPSQLLWNATLVLLALVLAAARPLVRHLLVPDKIEARPVPAAMAEPGDFAALALAKVQVVSMLAAAMLNALPMMLTLLAVLHAEAELALLVGVLTLVAATVAKPGFVNLILATETRLRRR